VVRDRLVVLRRENLVARLVVVGLNGAPLGEVALPGLGTVRDARAKRDDTRLWFTFESYSVPYSTWVVDVAAEKPTAATRYAPTRLETLPTTVSVDDLVSERVDLPSKDGTMIPVFLLRRKDTPLDGSAPTVLYGYGGFRVGQYPGFSRSWALWAEMGGVYAVASLRGGDEFGEEWHEAGCLGNKQNVFDDMIACADGLVAQGKVGRERLAVMGGSNGGLLVATVANQRPDLCRAVVCSVPLIDMLRYHRFQYALSWTKEYGDPDVKEHFDWIRPYSPYHNVKEGAAYPAALVSAGLKDGRVDAFHARKIVARWQEATSSSHPILLHLDRESGHGAASLLQAKRQILDRFCFLRMELGAK
jgi:prolyl oligopeptidase